MKAWVAAAAIGTCLFLAACQGKSDEEVMEEMDTARLKSKTVQLPGVAPVDPQAPLGAVGVDNVLVIVRAYNERAAKELVNIDQQEGRIRASASRALEAARGADNATEAQRQALLQRVATARSDAETIHSALFDAQVRLRSDTDEQITKVEAMMETCANDEKLSAYEGCVALEAEHETLLKNIDALTARYQASDLAYGAERAKLEEASAAVALAALR